MKNLTLFELQPAKDGATLQSATVRSGTARSGTARSGTAQSGTLQSGTGHSASQQAVASIPLVSSWDPDIVCSATTEFIAVKTDSSRIVLAENLEEILQRCFSDSSVAVVFGKHEIAGEGTQPLIDYTVGSVRDDFNFGPLIFLRTSAVVEALKLNPALAVRGMAGWYASRLAVSLNFKFKRSEDLLYTTTPRHLSEIEKEHFAYVDPKNAAAQKEFENVFTEYSKAAGFFLPERTQGIEVQADKFPVMLSVIIPVRNRKGTVADAVKSVLSQEADFSFNCIVVDNHSTDGTTEILKLLANNDRRLIHHIPTSNSLGIGGCWDVGVKLAECGAYVAQLDSDDIYNGNSVLQTIADKLRSEKLAGLAASYKLVDMSLKELPPGLVDHREWTDSNGHNNGLRINGFGAPRAFATDFVRKVGFKNVSYGEDYAMMLALTRDYKLGRIYEPLYLCRRWEGNSDAQPTIEKVNAFAVLKDGFRTEEILARKAIVAK